ncbi:hypothetical protein PDL71_15445 [Lacibacter sp. MH-610]|uniref:hypothetical protein n=1 Tax=Lacibacter sp. MH-610 TaxID=3020883 RepID=UPI0038919369
MAKFIKEVEALQLVFTEKQKKEILASKTPVEWVLNCPVKKNGSDLFIELVINGASAIAQESDYILLGKQGEVIAVQKKDVFEAEHKAVEKPAKDKK